MLHGGDTNLTKGAAPNVGPKSESTFVGYEYPLTDEDFKFISAFVYKQVGIVLADEKRAMVYARLSRRLRALHLTTFKEYCTLLEKDTHKLELGNLINAITTNLTRFFREDHHFEHLQQEVLEPKFCIGAHKHKQTDTLQPKKLRIWSAGCSTGEEPYSIAMTLLETFSNPNLFNLSIFATDVDTNVLKTAKEGIYKNPENAPSAFFKKYVNTLPNNMIQIKPEVKQLITFQQLNFLDEWPIMEHFDIIFCRNVVIYFDKPTQIKLFDRMSNLLMPNGWLYIGHSESLFNICNKVKLMGRTIYQKNG